ncbi:MAG TPA: carbohydrate ABC transporter permease [Fimbriimonadaceae bacterium]|nr:carbohydrate ABC transporter permease [Fimbriimonadaceae bacterium]
MSLVGKVGRKRPRARIAMAFLYIILSIGALTTVYPFALMVSTGFKGATDQNDNKLVPTFWTELESRDEAGALKPESLLGKYIDDKYRGDASMIASSRLGEGASGNTVQRYREFLEKLPLDYWMAGFQQAPNQVTSRLVIRYQTWLKDKYKSIEALNNAYIEENTDFQTIVVPSEQLDRKAWRAKDELKYREWLQFKATLPAEYRIPVRVQWEFQQWVKSKYQGQWPLVLDAIKGKATKFEEVNPDSAPEAIQIEFVQKGLPVRHSNESVESMWARFSHGGEIGPVARSGELPISVGNEPMPIMAFERDTLIANQNHIKKDFTLRNYSYVLDYILLNGRTVFNTVLFCLLAIVTQLTINPLAAYALSRYPIKASGRILIFLLATMAFPAEVALIPSFLLLKDLGLLNTFAALVLPTAASGYMIFLLKGFFDSLPLELYEAGQLDGAKEFTMLRKITLPLSKPVLGYLALLAFMGAYGTFIYAFLVVQDQRMWTLMVWIYQLQSIAPKAVMMAAITLAALPTLVVFLFAQNFIMRGIVLPGER